MCVLYTHSNGSASGSEQSSGSISWEHASIKNAWKLLKARVWACGDSLERIYLMIDRDIILYWENV